MNNGTEFAMPELLPQLGFRVRGRRADCIHCEGHSRLTVAFTDELAFCHRCQWRANTRTLARELGLLPDDPEARARFAAEQRERERRELIAQEFQRWRNARLDAATHELRDLGLKAALAHRVLQRFPDERLVWDALARFAHNEARLNRALDLFSCARASCWLEADSRIGDLFAAWQERRQAA